MKPATKTTPVRSNVKKPSTHAPIDISALLSRHHGVIYAVATGSCLAIALYLLSAVVTTPPTPDPAATLQQDTSSFDQDTITRVHSLRPLSEAPSEPSLPNRRTNPFRDN